MTASTGDVTKALQDFVMALMSCAFDADGYIIDSTTKARIMVGATEKLPVVLYRESLPTDPVHILNPLTDEVDPRPATAWFYMRMRIALIARLQTIMQHLQAAAMRAKAREKAKELAALPADKKKKGATAEEAPPEVPPEIMPGFVSTILAARIDRTSTDTIYDLMDADTYDEIAKFIKTYRDSFLNIRYISKHQKSILLIPLLDDSDPDGIGASTVVRKKTMSIMRALLRVMLGLDHGETLDRFAAKNDPDCPPKFTTFIKVCFRVFQCINELADWVSPDDAVDLGAWQHHIENMGAYYKNAQWLRMSTTGKVGVTAQGPQQVVVHQPARAIPSLNGNNHGGGQQYQRPNQRVIPSLNGPPQPVSAAVADWGATGGFVPSPQRNAMVGNNNGWGIGNANAFVQPSQQGGGFIRSIPNTNTISTHPNTPNGVWR